MYEYEVILEKNENSFKQKLNELAEQGYTLAFSYPIKDGGNYEWFSGVMVRNYEQSPNSRGTETNG